MWVISPLFFVAHPGIMTAFGRNSSYFCDFLPNPYEDRFFPSEDKRPCVRRLPILADLGQLIAVPNDLTITVFSKFKNPSIVYWIILDAMTHHDEQLIRSIWIVYCFRLIWRIINDNNINYAQWVSQFRWQCVTSLSKVIFYLRILQSFLIEFYIRSLIRAFIFGWIKREKNLEENTNILIWGWYKENKYYYKS